MKKNILIILGFILFTQLNGQPLFQKYYFTSVTDRHADISILSDSSLLISRQTIDSGNTYFQFIKTNSNGDTLWTRSGYDSLISHYYCIRNSGYEQFYIGGFKLTSGNIRSAVLMKSDNSGNIIWSKNYSDTLMSSILFVRKLSDGNLMLLGSNSPDIAYQRKGFISKVDSMGNIIWLRSNVSNSIFNYGEEMPDHGFITAGHPYYSIEDAFVTRFDSSGTKLWEKHGYGGSLKTNPVSIKDSSIISVSFMPHYSVPGLTINEYDFSGALILNRIIDFPDLNEVNEIIPTNNFGYLITGSSFRDINSSDVVVYKLDSAFNIEWRSSIENYPLENGTTSIETPRHSYYILANVNSITNNVKGFSITGLDSAGMILNISTPNDVSAASCNLYQNPFSISATLSIIDSENKRYSIDIFNMFGSLIYNNFFNSHSLLIQRGNWPAGIYFYRLTDGCSRICTGKFVIE